MYLGPSFVLPDVATSAAVSLKEIIIAAEKKRKKKSRKITFFKKKEKKRNGRIRKKLKETVKLGVHFLLLRK